ncbi:hypothetical protein [Streptomyces sp. OE57]|uniref:hypothetical protein n=1 Tax=Streptomyces lacaronensis TaxID=3379885 RepID=UPI0039B72BCB
MNLAADDCGGPEDDASRPPIDYKHYDPKDYGPKDFQPKCDFDPSQHGADDLIGYFAWAVTATAVAGLIIIGIRMAMQLQRGEGAAAYKGGVIIATACVIGATAGPLVKFLVVPYLI